MSRSAEHVLELLRAEEVTDPYGLRLGRQRYLLRRGEANFGESCLEWDEELLSRLRRYREGLSGPEELEALGETLRSFLDGAGWSPIEDEVLKASRAGRRARLVLVSAAAELYALPWMLVRARGSGERLGALPGLVLTLRWPGLAPAPLRVGAWSPVLFAWSDAGGAVPVDEHLAALGAEPLRVLERPTAEVLRAALERPMPGDPAPAVLHLLAHGQAAPEGLALALGPPGPDAAMSPEQLAAALLPHRESLRAALLFACRAADLGGLGARVGGFALGLHRGGIEAVIGSVVPLSTADSSLVACAVHGALHRGGDMDDAWLAARDALRLAGRELHLSYYALAPPARSERPWRGALPLLAFLLVPALLSPLAVSRPALGLDLSARVDGVTLELSREDGGGRVTWPGGLQGDRAAGAMPVSARLEGWQVSAPLGEPPPTTRLRRMEGVEQTHEGTLSGDVAQLSALRLGPGGVLSLGRREGGGPWSFEARAADGGCVALTLEAPVDGKATLRQPGLTALGVADQLIAEGCPALELQTTLLPELVVAQGAYLGAAHLGRVAPWSGGLHELNLVLRAAGGASVTPVLPGPSAHLALRAQPLSLRSLRIDEGELLIDLVAEQVDAVQALAGPGEAPVELKPRRAALWVSERPLLSASLALSWLLMTLLAALRWLWRPTLTLCLLAVASGPARAAALPEDARMAVAGVSSRCGVEGLATFFNTDAGVSWALTARHVVTQQAPGPGGRMVTLVCGDIALELPGGAGTLRARVDAQDAEQDLALLRVEPCARGDVACEGARSRLRALSIPSAEEAHAAAEQARPVSALGRPQDGLAVRRGGALGLEEGELQLRWDEGVQAQESDSGGPVVDAKGTLLGVFVGLTPGGSGALIDAGRVRAFVEDHLSLLLPTPVGQIGVWLARVPGDPQGEPQLAAIEEGLRRRLRLSGLDETVHIGRLDVALSGSPAQVEADARRLAAGVRADLIVSVGPFGFEGRLRTLVVVSGSESFQLGSVTQVEPEELSRPQWAPAIRLPASGIEAASDAVGLIFSLALSAQAGELSWSDPEALLLLRRALEFAPEPTGEGPEAGLHWAYRAYLLAQLFERDQGADSSETLALREAHREEAERCAKRAVLSLGDEPEVRAFKLNALHVRAGMALADESRDPFLRSVAARGALAEAEGLLTEETPPVVAAAIERMISGIALNEAQQGAPWAIDEAVDRALHAVELLGRDDPTEQRVLALLALAAAYQQAWVQGESGSSLERVTGVQAQVDRLVALGVDPEVEAIVAASRGSSLRAEQRPEQALLAFERASVLLSRPGDARSLQLVLIQEAAVLSDLGRWPVALLRLVDAEAACPGCAPVRPWLLLQRGRALAGLAAETGDSEVFGEAILTFEEAAALVDGTHAPAYAEIMLAFGGCVAARAGPSLSAGCH